MLNLRGKVALVTGAGSVGEGWGNGKATAVLMARQGAKVCGLDLNAESIAATAKWMVKAREELGWKPQVNIQEGVRRTLEWFVSLPENRHLQIKMPVLAEVK